MFCLSIVTIQKLLIKTPLRKKKNEYVEEETDDFLVDTSKQENTRLSNP